MSEPPSNSDPIAEERAAAMAVLAVAAQQPGAAGDIAAREPGSVGEFARKAMRDLRHPPTG